MNNLHAKVSRVLNLFLLFFVLVAVRVWYLGTVKHEEHLALSKKPKRHTVVELSNRGTIRDRDNIPLAINKIEYSVGVVYDPIRRLPRSSWVRNEKGVKEKIFYRKGYIESLAGYLSDELGIDPTFVEDTIHARASIFPNTFFPLRENISEETYYKLKLAERAWPGLQTQITPRRFYPEHKVGCHVLGFLGSISSHEHLRIKNELATLSSFTRDRENGLPVPLPKGFSSSDEVRGRLLELQEKSYTINSQVGKGGVEGQFDEDLRGYSGKQKYEIDIKGNFLRRLPESYPPTPGRRLLLSISSELQAFAEDLLATSEQNRTRNFSKAGRGHDQVSPPWISGGAIVAMVPKTGEVVAMASYPNFDPNDFTHYAKDPKRVHKWLESKEYIGSIWDGLAPLEKDLPKNRKGLSSRFLTWTNYLDMVLSKDSQARKIIDGIQTIQTAVTLQNQFDSLLNLSGSVNAFGLIDYLFSTKEDATPTLLGSDPMAFERMRQLLDDEKDLVDELALELRDHLSRARLNDDKLLILDLLRCSVSNLLFNEELLAVVGDETLEMYRTHTHAFCSVQNEVRHIVHARFESQEFPKWRKEYFKGYLEEKRAEEKGKKRVQRPYIEYLNEVKERLFEQFFSKYRLEFIKTYITRNAPFDLDHPLFGYFAELVDQSFALNPTCLVASSRTTLQNRLDEIPPSHHYDYMRSFRTFKDLDRPLFGKYHLNSRPGKVAYEKDLASHFYPAGGFGYMRSFAYQDIAPLGSIFKVVTASEALKQHHQRSPNGSLNPFFINDESPKSPYLKHDHVIGHFEDHTPITRVFKGGRLPKSHRAIGKCDYLKAMEQSSNIYFSLLASEVLEQPNDLVEAARAYGLGQRTGIELPGEARGQLPSDLDQNKTGLYALAIGQHSLVVTPLQTAQMIGAVVNDGKVLKPQILKLIANMEPTKEKKPWLNHGRFPYQDYLSLIGLYFPLFTETRLSEEQPYIKRSPIEILRNLELDGAVSHYLLHSLYNVINGAAGPGRPTVIRSFYDQPAYREHYKKVRPSLIGKTSTAEILYRPCLDREFKPILCTHTWFAGISFREAINPEYADAFKDPELVVVVYLRFADYGKEAIPIASEIINKWREIQAAKETE